MHNALAKSKTWNTKQEIKKKKYMKEKEHNEDMWLPHRGESKTFHSCLTTIKHIYFTWRIEFRSHTETNIEPKCEWQTKKKKKRRVFVFDTNHKK